MPVYAPAGKVVESVRSRHTERPTLVDTPLSFCYSTEMKLAKERIATLSKLLVETLLDEGLIASSSKKELLIGKIESVILDDLQVEDRLNAEVKEILKGYEKEIDQGNVDYQRMFQMIKKQLIKDRNLVI